MTALLTLRDQMSQSDDNTPAEEMLAHKVREKEKCYRQIYLQKLTDVIIWNIQFVFST